MTSRIPKLVPPKDLPAIDPRTGLFTEVWYNYLLGGFDANRIFGTTTNDSAVAGYLGEILTAGPTSQALTTATPANVTSKLLTPGDWDLFAPIQFSGAGSTTVTEVLASISATSATLDNTVGRHGHWRGTSTTDLNFPMLLGPVRISISASTTYYLVAQATFAVSTYAAEGALYARRAR